MQSGQFNKTITIYKEETIEDGWYESVTEVVVCIDRAKVSHIKSNETISNNIATYKQRKKLTIRKRPNLDIDTDMYIKIDTNKYNIIDIDEDSDRLYTHIYIEKVVG